MWHLAWAGFAGIASTAATVLPAPAAGPPRAHGTVLLLVALLPAMFSGFGNLAVASLPQVGRTAFPILGGLAAALAAAASIASVPALLCGGAALPVMLGLICAGLFASALDLTVTLLSGRGPVRISELSPLAVAVLVTGLQLLVLLPICAGLATRLVIASDPQALGVLREALDQPAICLLMLPALGVVLEAVCGDAGPTPLLALCGCLAGFVWAHHLLADGPVQDGPLYRASWVGLVGLPSLVMLPALGRGLWASRRHLGASKLHSIGFLVLLPIGLVQLWTGSSGRHGGLAFACLLATFAGLDRLLRDAGRSSVFETMTRVQFWTLASGAALMVAFDGTSHQILAVAGQAVSACSCLLFVAIALLRLRSPGRSPASGIVPIR